MTAAIAPNTRSWLNAQSGKAERRETVTEIVIVSFCVFFGLVSGLSLFKARATGMIRSRGWTFERVTSPTGFWLVAASDVVILIGSILIALHALGLIGSFPSTIRLQMPLFR